MSRPKWRGRQLPGKRALTHRNYDSEPDMELFTTLELELARSMMYIDEFEVKCPKAAAALIIKAGSRENVASILPDMDNHCEWSVLCEDQPIARSASQRPGRRDRMAIYVKPTHPSLEGSNVIESSWVWEDEL